MFVNSDVSYWVISWNKLIIYLQYYLINSVLFVSSPVFPIHTVWQRVCCNSILAVVSTLSRHLSHGSYLPQVNLQPLIFTAGLRAPPTDIAALVKKIQSCVWGPVAAVDTARSCDCTVRNASVLHPKGNWAPVNFKRKWKANKLLKRSLARTNTC